MLRLAIVLPLESLDLGAGWHLADWPLHVTVAPPFVIDTDLGALIAAVEPVLRPACVFHLTAGQDEGFGRSGTVPVSLVETSPDLQRLHRDLLAAITEIGGAFEDPEYIGQAYTAHITMTRSARVHPGDRLDLHQVTIVDMEPIGSGRLRRVVWAQRLTEPAQAAGPAAGQ